MTSRDHERVRLGNRLVRGGEQIEIVGRAMTEAPIPTIPVPYSTADLPQLADGRDTVAGFGRQVTTAGRGHSP
ncbi:MAG: hypothetical protein OEZ06_04020 [Myxococcales bacterium]|nr:hypothetical protein [Myxococcales bacterium]